MRAWTCVQRGGRLASFIHSFTTYRVGDWLAVAGRGPAGTLCSRLMGMGIEGGKSSVLYRDSRVEARRMEAVGRRAQREAALHRSGRGPRCHDGVSLLQTTGGRRSIEALCS